MNTKKTAYEIVKPEDLGFEGQAQPLNVVGASICVRALRQNWRQGTVACKDRSEVAFSNKKPWKQKGTGRARAGTRRSPLWRKGGVIFGPQKRVRTLKASKKLKHGVLRSMIENFLHHDRVIALHWSPEVDVPKTAMAFRVLKDAELATKKINLFVAPTDKGIQSSFVNIPQVRLMYFDECNVFDVAHADYIVFLKKDEDLFKEMVHTWI